MAIDYQGLLYGPNYDIFGVAATLTSALSSLQYAVTALDKTSGVAVTAGNNVEVQTILPAAVIRASDLADNNLTADDLDHGSISLNGKEWKITSHQPKPSPNGEGDGEYYLFLQAV